MQTDRFHREVVNGHKRTRTLKYKSVVLPNGIIANMFGPAEGRRHDAALLAESCIMDEISTFHTENNTPLGINPLCAT